MRRRILILGASYGSLLATKLLLAGHDVHLVCQPSEAELINTDGTIVRVAARGGATMLSMASRDLPGTLTASEPAAADPAAFDLVVLAMQEPQYRAGAVRELLNRVAKARVPCLAIMNMPPLPFLARLGGIQPETCHDCYTEPRVWDGFDPALVTMCSADPQAFRPPQEQGNVLQVGLPTNFKVARFETEAHTALLRQLELDIDAARFSSGGMAYEVPVKIRVHDSVHVPLAKWPMLMTGNYRCIGASTIRSIRDSVHTDLEESRAVYAWVSQVCRALGAAPGDLVPFDKYAAAATSLVNPSSVSRAVHSGAPAVERVDRLIRILAAQQGMTFPVVDAIVATVDARIEANRQQPTLT